MTPRQSYNGLVPTRRRTLAEAVKRALGVARGTLTLLDVHRAVTRDRALREWAGTAEVQGCLESLLESGQVTVFATSTDERWKLRGENQQ